MIWERKLTLSVCFWLQFIINSHFRFSPRSRQKLLSCGPRILTFFLYLSDVEEGGETVFTNLGIKVKPKRGRALIPWLPLPLSSQ